MLNPMLQLLVFLLYILLLIFQYINKINKYSVKYLKLLFVEVTVQQLQQKLWLLLMLKKPCLLRWQSRLYLETRCMPAMHDKSMHTTYVCLPMFTYMHSTHAVMIFTSYNNVFLLQVTLHLILRNLRCHSACIH